MLIRKTQRELFFLNQNWAMLNAPAPARAAIRPFARE